MMQKIKIQLSNKRTKTLVINVMFSFFIKGISLIISLFSLPLYIRYFDNQEVLGLWFAMLSLLNWIVTFDLGLGNGLRNKLAYSLANKDYKASKEYISSTYFILSLISLGGIIIGLIIIPYIDWSKFLNIDSSIIDITYLLKSIKILYIGIMLHLTLKLISNIYYAWQKAAVNNIISLLSSIIPLIYVILGRGNSINDKLINMSYVHIFASIIPLMIFTMIAFFSRELRKCTPSIKYISINTASKIIQLGGNFFLVQVVFLIITNTNEVFITYFFNPDAVVNFRIYNSIFSLVGSVILLAIAPVWSGITQAFANKDFAWIKKIYKLLFYIFIIATIGEICIIPLSQFIVKIWLQDKAIQVNYFYALCFSVYGILYVLNVILTTIANGLGYLKTQQFCYTIGVILKFPFIIITKKIFDSWIIVVIGNSIILLVFCIIQTFWLRKFLRNVELG